MNTPPFARARPWILCFGMILCLHLPFHPTSAQEPVTRDARVDTDSAGLVTRIAPGELLPVSISLANFGGGRRVDVLVISRILDEAGAERHASSETVAVETTATFVKTIQVPSTLPPGRYVASTSVTYEGQLVPATSAFSFTVERKILGQFQSDLILYGGASLGAGVLLFALGRTWVAYRRPRRVELLEYDEIPHDVRTFYEIISDTVTQMRQRVGDDAIFIASHVDGLSIDERTGRVLALSKPPAKVIATLVTEYEKSLGQKVSFSFRQEKRRR